MKEFIDDCLLFKSKDLQMKVIGVGSWIWIICVVSMVCKMFSIFTPWKN